MKLLLVLLHNWDFAAVLNCIWYVTPVQGSFDPQVENCCTPLWQVDKNSHKGPQHHIKQAGVAHACIAIMVRGPEAQGFTFGYVADSRPARNMWDTQKHRKKKIILLTPLNIFLSLTGLLYLGGTSGVKFLFHYIICRESKMMDPHLT